MRQLAHTRASTFLVGACLLSTSCTEPGGSPRNTGGLASADDDDAELETSGSETGADLPDVAESGGHGPEGDVLHGTDDDDRIEGDAAAETIYGYAGVDVLHGHGGDDIVYGGGQLDLLFGEAGDDVLHGEHGGDVLHGGPGDDWLAGGPGDDTYVYVRGEGKDTIDDVGGAFDRLILVGYEAQDLSSTEDGADVVLALPDGEIRIVGGAGAPVIEERVFEPPAKDVFGELDYGIYWHRTSAEAAKHIPGLPNPYFDPDRPTLIFVHGWSSGAVDQRFRDDLYFSDPDADLAEVWSDAGWNVGVFHWEQFADEGEVKDAEAKIWSASGPRGMRWLSGREGYADLDTHGRSVGDLFVRAYAQALAEVRSDTVRLAGHSLGNQLVTFGASQLYQQAQEDYSERLLPGRVALLDPFWSQGGKSYLGGRWTGEVARESVSTLVAQGLLIESYRSSPASNNPFIGDTNGALLEATCFTELKPWYYGALELAAKHNAAAWHYLWTFAFPAVLDDGGEVVCSAAAHDDDIEDGMRAPHGWVHEEGVYTMTPADDRFRRSE